MEELPWIVILPRGWFALRFHRSEQVNWVLSKLWHIEQAPVLFKRWIPLFDPRKEQVEAGPIWVRLPGFPLHSWSEDIMRHISNTLGTYLDHDKYFLT